MTDTPPTNSSITTTAKRVRRIRALQMIALSALLFASGAITGWSLFRFAPPRPPLADLPPSTMDRPDPPIEQMVRRYQHELNLSDDQLTKVSEIYHKRFDALKAIRDLMKPKLETEYAGLESDMQAVLTKDQFTNWDARYKEVRNRMLPPPPPPPRDGRRDNGNGPPNDNGPGPDGPPPDDNRPPPGQPNGPP